MRFEEKAAFAMGLLLPILETYRRVFGEWRVDFTTMFEDYLAGALLLAGAWAASRRRSFGGPLLLVAWAWVTGMMTISCVDQIEAPSAASTWNRAIPTFSLQRRCCLR